MDTRLRIIGLLCLVGLFAAAIAFFVADRKTSPAAPATAQAAPPACTFRLALIPERDLFQQRKAYQALARYLEAHGSTGHVELVTASSYAAALQDYADGSIDAGFMGSLVSVLAAEKHGAQVLLKSERLSGQATYSGVIVVRADSPVESLSQLVGKRIGGVRTTLAGSVFPLYVMQPSTFQMVWLGTHEDVLAAVASGDVDAGAVKDTRLDAYHAEHPAEFRILAESGRVPDNALVVSRTLSPQVREQLVATLLAMDQTKEGRAVLSGLGLRRYVLCEMSEYNPLQEMLKILDGKVD